MIEKDTNTGSTGSLGFAYRSYDRAYLNYPSIIFDPRQVQKLAGIGLSFVLRRRNGVTRAVLRSIVTESTLLCTLDNPQTSQLVECAVPTGISTSSNGKSSEKLWMMMGAVNAPERQPFYAVDEMVKAVDGSRRSPRLSPKIRISNLRSDGYRFINDISDDRVNEIVDLWGPTFDWSRDGVLELQDNLRKSQAKSPKDRGVWFTGIIDPQKNALIALAEAERLDIGSVSIIESTEWYGLPTGRRRGLAAGAVSHLHAKVFDDSEGEKRLVLAESNFESDAHHLGYAVGMTVPPREIRGRTVRQMLLQNVAVGDGRRTKGLRDFSMMVLSPDARNTYYSPRLCREILKGDL